MTERGMEMAGVDDGGEIMKLPEGCISHAISLTTPSDCCRSAAVSTTFRSAAESDTVWEHFLPPDHDEILARAVTPVNVSSKRDLYFRMCDSLIIDGGKMSFSLERSTGRKCYTLSARELLIIWGDTPNYWKWEPREDSRFSEVAVLLHVCWLEIRGKLDCKVLSRRTNYAAYLIFKLSDARGMNSPNQEASVRFGSNVSESVVSLEPNEAVAPRRHVGGHRFGNLGRLVGFRPTLPADGETSVDENQVVVKGPHTRHDGWMEMELGEFFNGDGDDGEVEMSLLEVKGGWWKSGLIVEGIEVRPK